MGGLEPIEKNTKDKEGRSFFALGAMPVACFLYVSLVHLAIVAYENVRGYDINRDYETIQLAFGLAPLLVIFVAAIFHPLIIESHKNMEKIVYSSGVLGGLGIFYLFYPELFTLVFTEL